jgi:DNA gyrase/topoisomerase IV subunit B
MQKAEFQRGELVKESKLQDTTSKNGTLVEFTPDDSKYLKSITSFTSTSIRCCGIMLS